MQVLKQLLWEATLKNIKSGNDIFSPLVQPLPKNYAQDDPELINLIREKYLTLPSDKEYNIQATDDTSMGQAQTVRKILHNKVQFLKSSGNKTIFPISCCIQFCIKYEFIFICYRSPSENFTKKPL